MIALLAALLVLPPVVMYHRVDPSSPSDTISQRLTIAPGQFEHELYDLRQLGLRTAGIEELAAADARRQPLVRTVLLTFDDGYSDQYRYAFPILKRFGDRAVFFINTGTIGTPRHMTWPEVETMAKAGMSIECHGVDHLDLSTLTAKEQTHQIDDCVRALRVHLQGTVLAVAYPSGNFNAQTIVIERRAGVLFGFTTDPRFQTDPRSPYQIARIRVMSDLSDARFSALVTQTRRYITSSD
jgi:peptidoglycan/xylan/chitin deacetylase (PgdA/CDA1 family)